MIQLEQNMDEGKRIAEEIQECENQKQHAEKLMQGKQAEFTEMKKDMTLMNE